MAGKTEYVEIVDAGEDEITAEFLKDHTAIGFEVTGIFELYAADLAIELLGRSSDEGQLPTERTLTVLH